MTQARVVKFQPPISMWGHIWRLLLMLAIDAFLWISVAERQTESLLLLDVALGLPAFVLVFFRRRWPVTIAVVVTLLSALSTFAAGPSVLAVVSVATWRRWRELAPIGIVAIAASLTWARVHPTPEDPVWIELSTNVIVTGALFAYGAYIGSRRELLWTLRNRAERAETEQELRVREARAAERTRIAREMHDVLAHRISQISMQAGALSFRDDLPVGKLRTGVGLIQEQAHTALEDLRGVLGVLRSENGAPLHTPQPTYAELPTLVDDARSSGMTIEFGDELPQVPMPDLPGRTLYRIVQEGITNARKHAPGARVTISITGSPEEGVSVEISNPLGFGPSPTPGAGLGLVGLAERAELAGGRLDYVRTDRTFTLNGWIPWDQ